MRILRRLIGALTAIGAAVLLILTAPHHAHIGASADTRPILMGWTQQALITRARIAVPAKLDSGARTSSLHVQDLRHFQRRGQHWVRFTITGKTGTPSRPHRLTLERPVLRIAHIHRANTAPRRRPVVQIRICLGPIDRLAHVTLTNRRGMRYPLLIGRRFMADRIAVHAAKRQTHPPECRR